MEIRLYGDFGEFPHFLEIVKKILHQPQILQYLFISKHRQRLWTFVFPAAVDCLRSLNPVDEKQLRSRNTKEIQ